VFGDQWHLAVCCAYVWSDSYCARRLVVSDGFTQVEGLPRGTGDGNLQPVDARLCEGCVARVEGGLVVGLSRARGPALCLPVPELRYPC
jgi:hypothetical protein